jgi:hypothetical protein
MFEHVPKRSISEAVKKIVRNCAQDGQPAESPSFSGPKGGGPSTRTLPGTDTRKPFGYNRSNASIACCGKPDPGTPRTRFARRQGFLYPSGFISNSRPRNGRRSKGSVAWTDRGQTRLRGAHPVRWNPSCSRSGNGSGPWSLHDISSIGSRMWPLQKENRGA